MASKKPTNTTETPAADAAAHASLRYVGPPGQTSPLFGALEPGRIYSTADADFAAYLVATHPDYWQRAAKE
jgi:hypothetical protein